MLGYTLQQQAGTLVVTLYKNLKISPQVNVGSNLSEIYLLFIFFPSFKKSAKIKDYRIRQSNTS
jgi:hypothetical protein